MNRIAGAAIAAALLAAAQMPARAEQTEQQTLVDRATLTVQDIMGGTLGHDPVDILRRARAVLICPRIFRAGFIFGAEGGGCVLVARDAGGSWSYPAFYGLGTGSVGFQIGIQDSEVVLAILTDKGLNAVMDSQFKIGADAGIAIAAYGAGVQGGTSAALNADIVAFSVARGLFAGLAINGSLLATRTDWNQAYYGKPLGARQVVVEMSVTNPGADPLREVLTKFGSR